MTALLPPEIVVTESPEEVCYQLPRRDTPRQSWIAGCLLAGCLTLVGAVVLVPLGVLVAPLVGLNGATGGVLLPALCFAFLMVEMWRSGRGFSEITIREGMLISRERGSLLWPKRRRLLTEVCGLTVEGLAASPSPDEPQSPAGPPVASNVGLSAGIKVTCQTEKPITLAPGYPPRLLEQLAADLGRRLGIAPGVAYFVVGSPRTVTDRFEKPADSLAVVEQTAGGITITLPPAGLTRGNGRLFWFAVFWIGQMVVITCLFLRAVLSDGQLKGEFGLFIVLAPFWLVGIGLALGVYHAGRRRAVLAVIEDTLMLMQEGPLGTKRAEWARAELADIRPGPSGSRINNRPVVELQIHPKQGKPFRLLAGRDVAELEWVATLLRQALRVPAETEPVANG